jgi:hypothetical protein
MIFIDLAGSTSASHFFLFAFLSEQNRSRKCPACGIRFDMKDVGDIWL